MSGDIFPRFIAQPMKPPPPLPVDEERYADRILGNEALGEGLTDAQYGPLLDRALRKLHVAALRTRGMSVVRGEAFMEIAYAQIVTELRRAVELVRFPVIR